MFRWCQYLFKGKPKTKSESESDPDIQSLIVIDKRTKPQALEPVEGDIDPIHAMLISAAMQDGKAVRGNFDPKKKTITIESLGDK